MAVSEDVRKYVEEQLALRQETIIGIIMSGGEYVDNMQKLQTEHITAFQAEMGRMNAVVMEANTIKEAINVMHSEMGSSNLKLDELNKRGLAADAKQGGGED